MLCTQEQPEQHTHRAPPMHLNDETHFVNGESHQFYIWQLIGDVFIAHCPCIGCCTRTWPLRTSRRTFCCTFCCTFAENMESLRQDSTFDIFAVHFAAHFAVHSRCTCFHSELHQQRRSAFPLRSRHVHSHHVRYAPSRHAKEADFETCDILNGFGAESSEQHIHCCLEHYRHWLVTKQFVTFTKHYSVTMPTQRSTTRTTTSLTSASFT